MLQPKLPPLYMAPMAGISDGVFRRIVRDCGADLTFSEMVSSRGIFYKDKKTASLMTFREYERPFVIQLFGNEPDVMADAVKAAQEYMPDGIDINMGCPMPKIVNNGDGGALMKTPALAGKVCEAAAKATRLPVSVKFRSGWDDESINAAEFARVMEASGAARLTVHPRTVRQLYSGLADMSIARQVVDAVKLPVTVSGDIRDIKSACAAAETGAQALMIGRAALGDPWLFRRLKTQAISGTPEEISVSRRLTGALVQAQRLCEAEGERTGMRESRKFSAWYIRGFADAANLRGRVCRVSAFCELDELLRGYITEEIEEGEVF